MIPKAIPMEIRHIVFLLIFFILYVILGGMVFMVLESPEEQIQRKEIETLLADFTLDINGLNNTWFTERKFRTILHKLLVAQDNNLIDTHGNQQPFINWSFVNSFFFAITVITTIGYGHLTPTTTFGKIFCIIYALFGIPITSLLIGSVADRFSKLYSPEKANGRITRRRRHDYQRQLSARLLMLQKGLISLVPWFFAFLIVPAMIFRHYEHWSFLDGFYYCFITLSTIGFGDFVAGSFEENYVWIYKILVVFWIIFGVAYLSMVLNFITNSLRSRHISNVVQSLRFKINSNVSGSLLAARMRKHQEVVHCHSNRYQRNRKQSSPMVMINGPANDGRAMLQNDHQHTIINNNNNNNFLHIISDNNLDGNSIVSESKSMSNYTSTTMEPLNDDDSGPAQPSSRSRSRSRRKRFIDLFIGFFKPAQSQVHPQDGAMVGSNPNSKNSLRCAYEEQPVVATVIRQTSSLPDMSEVSECIDPDCSINLDHHPPPPPFPTITIV